MIIPPEILTVAKHLGELRSEVVFVGGMVRSLLVTDPGVPGLRPTKDVDLIVSSVSLVERADLSALLRKLGFREDMGRGCAHLSLSPARSGCER